MKAFVVPVPFYILLCFAIATSVSAESFLEVVGADYELVAVDQSSGRAVLVDGNGVEVVLAVDVENADGLRLKSVSRDAVLLDVRFKSSGEVNAYRIGIGQSVRVRAPSAHRRGGIRVVDTVPQSGVGEQGAAIARE